MDLSQSLSDDTKRNKAYQQVMQKALKGTVTYQELLVFGATLMKKAKLHHHFFGDHSWEATACALMDYARGKKGKDHQKLDTEEVGAILSLFEKRIEKKIPVEYITHEATYSGHTFYVNEHVLVPRSVMNTRFNDFLKETKWENYRVLDLCTGSGCIGITLALLKPELKVDCVDISEQALEVAAENVEKYQLQERVQCIQSDLFKNLTKKYDLIITNPPYVSEKTYQRSPAEFKSEPEIALKAGVEGLDIIHRIINNAKPYLNENGVLIGEVGSEAATRLRRIYRKNKFTWLKYRTEKGKVSWFISPSILYCKRKQLP